MSEDTGEIATFPINHESEVSLEFKTAVKEGVDHFTQIVKARYGDADGVGGESPRAFHNLGHTEYLLNVGQRIATVFLEANQQAGKKIFDEEELAFVPLPIAAHDARVDQDENGKNKRVENEKNSLAELIGQMREKPAVFSPKHEGWASAGIYATIPDVVRLNPDDPRAMFSITQPYLTRESPITAFIVGMSDLAEAGEAGPDALMDTAVKLAIEDSNGVVHKDLLATYTQDQATLDAITLEEKYKGARNTLVGFYKFQYGFTLGQAERYSSLIGALPQEVHAGLHEIFNKFDASTKEMGDVYKAVGTLSTGELFSLAFGDASERRDLREKIKTTAQDVPDSALPVPQRSEMDKLLIQDKAR